MKIIFFGSDDFAAINLQRLIDERHTVVACVTPPDRPQGRGLKVVPSPVKECARKYKIPLLQPEVLRDVQLERQLSAYMSDVFVVIAYGKILPADLLKIPRLCAVNLHGSLLPRYRGAAPINWAIISGEHETGVSVIRLNELMDAGDILLQRKIRIEENDDAVTLRAKMATAGAACLHETLQLLDEGTAKPVKQDLSLVTHAPKLTKELGIIEWNKSAAEIHNLVRGLLPWPTAHTFYNGKTLKILFTTVIPATTGNHKPGEILEISSAGLRVATAKNELLVQKVHLESAKAMEAHRFALGHGVKVGFCFSGK